MPNALTWIGGGVVLAGIGVITVCDHRRSVAAAAALVKQKVGSSSSTNISSSSDRDVSDAHSDSTAIDTEQVGGGEETAVGEEGRVVEDDETCDDDYGDCEMIPLHPAAVP